MARRHVPVARFAALAALLVGAWAITHPRTGPHWRSLSPGVEFGTLRGDPYCRHGSSSVALLRFDPQKVRLSAHHYSLEPDRRPLTIVEWQHRTRALAVFNAGQYYPDYSYMGLLVCAGRVVSSRLHPSFRAALVASPQDGGRAVRVMDLSRVKLDPRQPGWGEVAQSFMLFDHRGEPRVRKSSHVANRTAVGEDRHGRLVVITSEGGYTLWEFAQLLQRAPLQLSHAMAMDGGAEAELCVAAGRFRYASFGRWDGGSEPSGSVAQVALPAVIAVAAR